LPLRPRIKRGRFNQQLAERMKSTFTGYQGTELLGAKVIALIKIDNEVESEVEKLSAGEQGEVVLDRTPFLCRIGRQIGDTGVLENESVFAKVSDTFAPLVGLSLHKIQIESGELKVGNEVAALVDAERRRRVMLNHTATHLMHAAFKRGAGTAYQAGRQSGCARSVALRFHPFLPLSRKNEISEIERLVNEQISVIHSFPKKDGYWKAMSSWKAVITLDLFVDEAFDLADLIFRESGKMGESKRNRSGATRLPPA